MLNIVNTFAQCFYQNESPSSQSSTTSPSSASVTSTATPSNSTASENEPSTETGREIELNATSRPSSLDAPNRSNSTSVNLSTVQAVIDGSRPEAQDMRESLNSGRDICAICLDSLDDRAHEKVTETCEHRLHTVCKEQLMRSGSRRCPLCREQIRPIRPIAPRATPSRIAQQPPIRSPLHSSYSERTATLCCISSIPLTTVGAITAACSETAQGTGFDPVACILLSTGLGCCFISIQLCERN